MTRTVVALYDDFTEANRAVRELVEHGFSRDDISLMASDATGDYSRNLPKTSPTASDAASGATEGAGVGAGVGAVIGGLGGLLVGLGALTIPGIGPVLAAGPLAAALTGLAGAGVGAVAGGVAGGVLGALVDMGVPHETAQYYAEGVRRGGTLLTLRVPDNQTNQAVEIMNRHNPVDINQRATQWRQSGWTTFNPQGEPYQNPDVSSRPVESQRDLAEHELRDSGRVDTYNTSDRMRDDASKAGRSVSQAASDVASGAAAAASAAAASAGESRPRDYERSDVADQPSTRAHEAGFPRNEAPVDENEEKLWPKDDLRPADEKTGSEVERDLWQGEDTEAPPVETERQLWPRDELRPADEQAGTEVERDLWQGDQSEFPSEHLASQYPAFNTYDTDFRHHFESTYSGGNTSYDQYVPAYRYGYDLATDERYRAYDWDRLEPEARRYWDERNPGSWDRFKMAIRHAWEEIKDSAS